MQGRIVQHSGIGFELVQALDVPVLQMVEQPVEVDSSFRNFVLAVAEQVIEVPMLALPGCAVQRAALSEPQTVEQLVEVPTVLSFSLLQQRTAEQIIDFPVLGRGGGARGGLQGLPQGQGFTVSAGEQTIVPVCGGLQGLHQGQGSTASAGELTIVVDRGGLQGFPRGQGVRSRCSASLPVWNRRTVMRLWHMHGWFAGYVAPRAVLFFLLPGQDAWHLGRFVSEGQLCAVAYARVVCWLRCTPCCISDSVQALAVGSGTASRAHCHLQARLRCTPLACSPFVQVHVSTSGVLTLGCVTNAGAGYWKVLN